MLLAMLELEGAIESLGHIVNQRSILLLIEGKVNVLWKQKNLVGYTYYGLLTWEHYK